MQLMAAREEAAREHEAMQEAEKKLANAEEVAKEAMTAKLSAFEAQVVQINKDVRCLLRASRAPPCAVACATPRAELMHAYPLARQHAHPHAQQHARQHAQHHARPHALQHASWLPMACL